jgi:hypothetical protein
MEIRFTLSTPRSWGSRIWGEASPRPSARIIFGLGLVRHGSIVNAVNQVSWTSNERAKTLVNSVRHVVETDIAGGVSESWVW